MAMCRFNFTIGRDENFAIVDEFGWPMLSVYRRQDGELEFFFEQIEDGLTFEEAKEIAGKRLRRQKATSLDEEPDEVQIVPGLDGLRFARPDRSK
jgi:hypothetical protein